MGERGAIIGGAIGAGAGATVGTVVGPMIGVNTVPGAIVGGVAGAVIGSELEDKVEGPRGPASTSYPPQNDYSAAMVYASDNNKTVSLAQIQAQIYAMQQASMDRQMQLAASLELGIERLDTKLQIAQLDFVEHMTVEQDRHEEKMKQIFATNTNYDGLPAPEAEVA